jgi:SAM-dependent methyltransferase
VPVQAPLPPEELAARVGSVEGVDPLRFYEAEGAAVRARIERFLPADWSFDGKRVLDFGCGSGRVLRHFLDQAGAAELWGCDIHGPSIDWLRANLSPPFHFFQNQPEPGLPFEGGHLDLIWATSVMTHITDNWSGWLMELDRVLAPGGLLIASFLGEGVWDAMVSEPYREDEVGMTVLRHWQDGPWVFHSEWWLRAHWGRLFEILEVARPPRTDDGSPQITHSYIVLAKRKVEITARDLELCSPDEPRELAGLQTNIRLLQSEIAVLVQERPERQTAAASLRKAILTSPLGGPAKRLRGRLRKRR